MAETVRQWRVPRRLLALKATGAVLFGVLAGTALGDPQFLLLSAVACLGCAALALRDLLAPVRLAADAEGVVLVQGLAGRHRLLWEEIERIGIDERSHFGIRTRLLEIESADGPHLLSRFDLGTEPDEAAEELYKIRGAAPHR